MTVVAYKIPRLRSGRQYVVYALLDPRTGEVRYVGKSSGYLNSRIKRHIHEAATSTHVTHKLNWLRQLAALSLEPDVRIIESASTKEELPEIERKWIAELRGQGVRLTNMTDGGEGMPNPSEDTRVKLRARAQVGFTPETRRRAAEALRASWQDPEWRAKRMASMREQYGPPRVVMTGERLREWRVANAVRMGAGNRGKPKTAGHRRKIAETNLARLDPDRQRKALALREAGLSYGQIAASLGYAHAAGAHHAVRRAQEQRDSGT